MLELHWFGVTAVETQCFSAHSLDGRQHSRLTRQCEISSSVAPRSKQSDASLSISRWNKPPISSIQ